MQLRRISLLYILRSLVLQWMTTHASRMFSVMLDIAAKIPEVRNACAMHSGFANAEDIIVDLQPKLKRDQSAKKHT